MPVNIAGRTISSFDTLLPEQLAEGAGEGESLDGQNAIRDEPLSTV